MTIFQSIKTDVFVIGSGAAGLQASIYAAQTDVNINVLLIDKGVARRSGSTVGAVQMTSAGKWATTKDNFSSFFNDTIESGQGLSDRKLVHVLVSEIEERLDNLVRWGLRLDKNDVNEVRTYESTGHTYERSISAGKGRAGFTLTNVLIREINRLENIRTLNDVIAIELLLNNGKISGVLVYNLAKNHFIIVQTKAVILATGGIGQLYETTSNPVQSTGDGFALALRAGATLIEMEQVQFYPVSLIYPASIAGYCISFYHLGKLYNAKGERFMINYDCDNMENVNRDVLSRAIFSEINVGCGTENGGVLLDVTDCIERIKLEYPHEYKVCLQMGTDLAENAIEVGPAAHFMMGGVEIDADTNTSIQGLFVAGETAGGLHGANRLANNSISECVVFGARAGMAAADYAQNVVSTGVNPRTVTHPLVDKLENFTGRGTYKPYQLTEKLQQIMSTHVAIARTQTGLLKAQDGIDELKVQLNDVEIHNVTVPLARDVLDYIELTHMLITAEAIVSAALTREESRGAHYRVDFLESHDRIEHTCTNFDGKEIKVTKREVWGGDSFDRGSY